MKIFFSILLSILIAISAYTFSESFLIRHIDDNKKSPNTQSISPLPPLADDISTLRANVGCWKLHSDTAAFEKCRAHGVSTQAASQPLPVETESLGTPKTGLIVVIKWLLILGLSIQVYLTLYTLWLPKSASFDRYVFHLSDWALNTPPILGVLANLLTFALTVSNGTEAIQSLFSEYFFEAVVTTLIGGLFYVINLALKVIIQSRIDSLEHAYSMR